MNRSHLVASARAARLLPLREDHLDDVLAIEEEAAPAGWSRNVFLAELARPESRCYLVLEVPSAGVVAFGGMQLQVDEAHITTLAVAAAHRRRKLATRLLIALLREARARGAHAATLEVRLHNVAAQRLYAGVGFRPVGVRPRYYQGSVDALIMWAHDIDGPEFGRMLDTLAADIADGAAAPGRPQRER